MQQCMPNIAISNNVIVPVEKTSALYFKKIAITSGQNVFMKRSKMSFNISLSRYIQQ